MAATLGVIAGDFVVERNTFLDLSPPPEPGLLRASTAPVSSTGDETSSEPDVEFPGDLQAHIPEMSLVPAPPMLPLEFYETPDAVNFPEGTPLDTLKPAESHLKLKSEESICEKNTFLELRPPALPELARAKTEPTPNLDVPEAEAEGNLQSEDKDDFPPPPMLPLEFTETPNVFHDPHGVMGNLSLEPPPGLKSLASTFNTDTPEGNDDLVSFARAGLQPLPLEKMQTFDNFGDFHPSPSFLEPELPRTKIILQDVIPDSELLPVTFAQLPPPPAAWAPDMQEPLPPQAPAVAPREGAAAAPSSSELRPGVLIVNSEGGTSHVHWAVDGRKLFNTDVRVVSSQFLIDIPGEGPQPFKITLVPKLVINNKRGGGFKKAKGKGSVMLKCEAGALQSPSKLSFTLRVGNGAKLQPPRGPVLNNFSEKSLCGLPEGQEEWDFRSLVDEESDLLLVHVQIDVQS